MKKIALALIMCLSVLCVSAQTTWRTSANNYIMSLNGKAKNLEKTFAGAGINIKMSSGFDPGNECVLIDFRFDENVWKTFNKQALNTAKETILSQYRSTYRTDKTFTDFIKSMKENKARFKITYSCVSGNKIKNKEFYITPDEIMK